MQPKVLHSETLTEFSGESASWMDNWHIPIQNDSPRVYETSNSAYVEIMRLWDRINPNPMYETGKKALELWLSGQFGALEEGYVGPADFSLQAPIELGRVLEDSLVAYGKRERSRLRIWNGAQRKIEDANMFLRILSSRFQRPSMTSENAVEPYCLSIFGIKATKSGIL